MADSTWGDLAVRVLPMNPAPPTQVHLLEEAERARASKFVRRRDAEAFLAGRIALRSFAADMAGVPAGSLTATYACSFCGDSSGDHGRPGYALADGSGAPLVSLSRAGNWLLLAGAARGHALAGLGVDAELAARMDFEGFEAFLARREAGGLARLNPEARLWQRARLWARKEAFVKATGVGLVRDPASIDVIDDAVEGVLLTDLDSRRLGLPADLVAALAVRPFPDTAGKSMSGL